MKKQTYAILVVPAAMATMLTVLVTTPSDIRAQTRGQSAATSKPPSEASVPFDVSAESLPSGYIGMDPLRIIKALKGLKTAKDEFETTDAYNARLSQITKSPLYGSLTVSDTIAFKVRDTDIGDITFDADRGQVSVKGLDNRWHGGMLQQGVLFEFLTLRVVEKVTSSSKMSNAFGAQVDVLKSRSRVAAIVFPFVCRRLRGPLWLGDASWPASVADAQAFKVNHGILLVGGLLTPYYSIEHNLHTPEISQPWDQDDTVEGIRFEVREIWYYIPSTGKIVYKNHTLSRPPCKFE